MRICPYCNWKISDTAKKCKHCWERVNQLNNHDESKKIENQKWEDKHFEKKIKKVNDWFENINRTLDKTVENLQKKYRTNNDEHSNDIGDTDSSNSSVKIVLAVLWIFCLIYTAYLFRAFLFWIILLVLWVFLIIPYYIDYFNKK